MAYRHHLTNERREELAKQVLEFRMMFRRTQRTLAEWMGVSERTIRNIEDDRVCPSAKTVSKFRKVESRLLGSAKIDRWPEN